MTFLLYKDLKVKANLNSANLSYNLCIKVNATEKIGNTNSNWLLKINWFIT